MGKSRFVGEYEHTQRGTLILWVVGGPAVVTTGLTVLLARSELYIAVVPGLVTLLLVACAYLFSSLTVSVARGHLLLAFGPGLIRKSFVVASICHARIVQNPWYYGWGIRFMPNGWLYNVSGFDAVEIRLTNGQTYRIGTDEPSRLLAAIEAGTTQDSRYTDA